MSTNYYAYIGAYLKCENEIIDKPIYKKICCNTYFGNHNKFCTQCGKKLDKKSDEIEKAQLIQCYHEGYDSDDLLKYIYANEFFNYDVFLSNLHTDVGFVIEEEYFATEITEEMKNKCVSIFKELHSEDIEQLKQIYNGKVDVEFGVVGYYM